MPLNKAKSKIAIIFRGPIRPDVESVAKNIRLLKENFSKFDVDTYLITWNNIGVSNFITNEGIDNLLIIKEPSKEFISQKLTTRTKENSLFDRNYKAFWSVRTGIKLVLDTKINYDWIVLTRTDLAVHIEDIEKWLSGDDYVMPTQENYIINDQFGIAKPMIMDKAWDYIDLPNLNKLYGQSVNPEDCLKKIMEMNGVNTKKISADFYSLDIKRHDTDKDYLRTVSKSKKQNERRDNLRLIVNKYRHIWLVNFICAVYKKCKT